VKIIPAIDLMEGKVVRLVKGDAEYKTIYSDDPIAIAKKWQIAGADMIHLVDLDATLGLGSNLEIIKKVISQIDIPIQVAGGLRTESAITQMSQLASRIVIGTLAFNDKTTLQKLLETLGSKKIVISVDHIDGNVVVNGWQKRTGEDLINSMKKFLQMGFSEFLLTNVNRDGTMEGPDLKFLSQACALDNANVISSGGISNVDDVKQVKEKNASGVILGKALYEKKISIEEAKKVA